MNRKSLSPLPFGQDLWITCVISSMVYIIFLITICFFALSSTSTQWQSEYYSKIVIQLPLNTPENSADIIMNEKVVAVLKEDPGIKSYKFVDKSILENIAGLLSSSSMPVVQVPSFIQAEIYPQKWSLPLLSEKLTAIHPECSILDTHTLSSKFMKNIQTLEWVFYLLCLILFLASTVVMIVVTRFEVAVHKDIIHILYLLGARDDYIAFHFQKRGRFFGFKGGIIGSVLGALTSFIFLKMGSSEIVLESLIWPLIVLLVLGPLLTSILCDLLSRLSSGYYIQLLQQKN